MSIDAQTTDKYEAFLELLEQGLTMLHMDARAIGVDVPRQYQDDAHLRLNFSYRFQLDTFEIDEKGIVASLSFGGVPHTCQIPWTAVFAMTQQTSGASRVWAMDIPIELVQEVERAVTNTSELVPEPTFEAVEDTSDGQEDTPETDESASEGRRVGHLRVIK